MIMLICDEMSVYHPLFTYMCVQKLVIYELLHDFKLVLNKIVNHLFSPNNKTRNIDAEK